MQTGNVAELTGLHFLFRLKETGFFARFARFSLRRKSKMEIENINRVKVTYTEEDIHLNFDGFSIVVPKNSKYVFHTNDRKTVIKLPILSDIVML